MKAIVNAPFRYPQLNCGSMYYGLANEAHRHQHYRSYLKMLSAKGYHVILDNAADELGEGMSGDMLMKLAEDIQPTELILPDVLQNGFRTFQNSTRFYDEYRNDLHCRNLMVVPQGKTFEEYMFCYEDFQNWDHHNVVGIPYDIEFDVPEATEESFSRSAILSSDTKTTRRAKRRLNLLRYLEEYGHLDREVHLLGMNNLKELRAYQHTKILWIRSNDTTAPFAAASVERIFTDGESGEKDWPALDFDVKWDSGQYFDAKYNLFQYLYACGDIEAMYKFAEFNATDKLKFTPEWEKIRVR